MSDLSKKQKRENDYLVVRAWPETIYFYPSMIVAFLAFVHELILRNAGLAFLDQDTVGWIFAIVFAFNFFVVAFDFSVSKVVIIFLVIGVIVLLAVLGWYIAGKPPILGTITLPSMNIPWEFYGFYWIIVLFHLLFSWIVNHLVYWEFRPTEIYLYRGIFGDSKRFGNAQHAHITKETPDIFEQLLFLAGDIYVKPEGDPHVYRIKNVFNVAAKEKRIREILSYVPDRPVD